MSLHGHEGRVKSHTAGSRMRGDVRFASKDEDSRRFDVPHRPKDRYTSHPCEMENERIVHIDPRNDELIVRVPNELCRNPNASSFTRRSRGVSHSQAPVRTNFKPANNGHPTDAPSQPRTRFDTSGRQRPLSFREELVNVPEPSMLPLGWKPGVSRVSMNYRPQGDPKARQRGNGRRGMSSTPRPNDWDRSSGGRRGGGARESSNGGGRMRRRRGGTCDDVMVSFRTPDNENAHDQNNQAGEKPRGGLRHRGGTRGFRSARRGGTWRGPTDLHFETKNEFEAYVPDIEEHRNSENPEDSNSTDDDQYCLTVDLKAGDVQHADTNPALTNDREEHIDGGLNIVVESHEEAVESSEEHSEEEELDDSEEESEVSGGGPASDTDGDVSEEPNEVLEEDGSSRTDGESGEPGSFEKGSAQESAEETNASDDIGEPQDPSAERPASRGESPPHEHGASQISGEETSPTDPPIEVIETDSKMKTAPTKISPEMNKTCSKEGEKVHCLGPSGSIVSEDSGRNPQLTQDSGDCETSFESVPADESHNSPRSILNDVSALNGEKVTMKRPEISVQNVERLAEEAPLESSVDKDQDMKIEEPPTEKVLEGK